MNIIITKHFTSTSKEAYLSAAELEEDVDVVLIFKMMREFDDMFVLEGSVQFDFIRYLTKNHNMTAVRMITRRMIFYFFFFNLINPAGLCLPCPSGVAWTLCFVGLPSQHTSCCWKYQSSHNSEQTLPVTEHTHTQLCQRPAQGEMQFVSVKINDGLIIFPL